MKDQSGTNAWDTGDSIRIDSLIARIKRQDEQLSLARAENERLQCSIESYKAERDFLRARLEDLERHVSQVDPSYLPDEGTKVVVHSRHRGQ